MDSGRKIVESGSLIGQSADDERKNITQWYNQPVHNNQGDGEDADGASGQRQLPESPMALFLCRWRIRHRRQ